MSSTFVFTQGNPPPPITIKVPKATITANFTTVSTTVPNPLNTSVDLEEISGATSHAGQPSTRFFHLMFDEQLDQDEILALLNGLAIDNGSGFITFYKSLTGATAAHPQAGQPASNPLTMPILPDDGDPTQGNMQWLYSVVAYLEVASTFYSANLGANQTTCFTMIVTTDPATLMTVLSIGIAAGLHSN